MLNFILVVFLVSTMVLVMNLIIAAFNFTYSKVSAAAEAELKVRYCNIVVLATATLRKARRDSDARLSYFLPPALLPISPAIRVPVCPMGAVLVFANLLGVQLRSRLAQPSQHSDFSLQTDFVAFSTLRSTLPGTARSASLLSNELPVSWICADCLFYDEAPFCHVL